MSGQEFDLSPKEPPRVPPEVERWVHDLIRQDAHRAHDANRVFHISVNEATIKSSDAALRATLIINGGAAVSVLAFIGGLVAQRRIELNQLSNVADSLMFFAAGVAASVAAMGLSYLTNFLTVTHAASFVNWWEHPYIRPGPKSARYAYAKNTVHIIATIVALGSLGLFIVGMLSVRAAIVGLGGT